MVTTQALGGPVWAGGGQGSIPGLRAIAAVRRVGPASRSAAVADETAAFNGLKRPLLARKPTPLRAGGGLQAA